MKRILLTIVFIFIISSAFATLKIGTKAPSFSLPKLGCKEVVLDSILGEKPIIIHIWETR